MGKRRLVWSLTERRLGRNTECGLLAERHPLALEVLVAFLERVTEWPVAEVAA